MNLHVVDHQVYIKYIPLGDNIYIAPTINYGLLQLTPISTHDVGVYTIGKVTRSVENGLFVAQNQGRYINSLSQSKRQQVHFDRYDES